MANFSWPVWVRRALTCILALWLVGSGVAQDAPVTIRVDATASEGELGPVWSYFGYDEPNYTYAPNGKKLLSELRQLSPAPVYVRVHNLLTSGDGSASRSGVRPTPTPRIERGNLSTIGRSWIGFSMHFEMRG